MFVKRGCEFLQKHRRLSLDSAVSLSSVWYFFANCLGFTDRSFDLHCWCEGLFKIQQFNVKIIKSDNTIPSQHQTAGRQSSQLAGEFRAKHHFIYLTNKLKGE